MNTYLKKSFFLTYGILMQEYNCIKSERRSLLLILWITKATLLSAAYQGHIKSSLIKR